MSMIKELIEKVEALQKEAREGMKRASKDSDPYLYQYLVGKFHAFGKVAGILKKQKEPHYTKRNALFDKCVENCDPATMKRVSDEVDEMLEKEQKPAEWGEEDEDMLNSCISSIEEAKENRYAYKETDGDTSYDHEIAWLKLLRNRVGKEFLQPHWKPSEEQMEALQRAIDACGSEWAYQDDELRSLLNDLKKL